MDKKFLNTKILFLLILILVLFGIVAALQKDAATKPAFINFQNSFSGTKAQTVENSQMPVSTPLFYYATTTISAPKGNIVVQIADTSNEQTQGLSDRLGLAEGTGMIFVFNSPAPQYMWMKDMNFALDMVWLDQNKKVVHIAADATPQSYEKNPPEIFFSETPALYVIELPSGDAGRFGIALDSLLSFETSR